jgi:hypothetical protein
MRWQLVLWFTFGSPALLACGTDWAVPSGSTSARIPVSLAPFGDAGLAPPVLRLRVTGAATLSKLDEFRVFKGELSEYHLGRIAARELPKTLHERAVPAVTWAEGDDVVVAPAVALPSGRYSLASPELRLLSEFTVDAALVPWLERTWPPSETTAGHGAQIFCGEGAASVAAGSVMLAPSQRAAELLPGFAPGAAFAGECVTLTPSEPLVPGALVLPPVLAGGVALEPRPLFGSERSELAIVCAEGERVLGPVCASNEDDRIRLRSAGEPSLWVTERPAPSWFVIAAKASAVVRGFVPGAARPFTARAFDAAGAAWDIEEMVTGLALRERVLINEVLANPNGPEASGEWIELVNDGQRAVELSDYELIDSGGVVALPSTRLAPGEYALLVGPRFDPDPELDSMPNANAAILRMPSLGNAGLANSGELLRLQHRSGREVSRVPALPAAKSGFSLARRTLDAGDTANDFAIHAPPGASPGGPNTFAEDVAP